MTTDGEMTMRKQNDGTKVRVDRYTRWCLTVIAVLLTVLIVGLWGPGSPWASDATAQSRRGKDGFVDPAMQRDKQVKAIQSNGAKLQEIINLLKSGVVKVKVVDDAKGAQGGEHAPKK